MSEEIGVVGGSGWRKAIPEARDRLQSRWLVGVVGTVLVAMTASALVHAYSSFLYFIRSADRTYDVSTVIAVAVSVAFAGLVLMLRAATPGGALCGGMICLLLVDGTVDGTISTGHAIVRSGLAPLALLFVLTFVSTKAGRGVKTKAGLAEKRRGRSASQVIANLSVAALSVSGLGSSLVMGGEVCCGTPYYSVWVRPAMMLMCLAALGEATADTVSSEIGQAFGGRPVLVVGLRRVEPGTDGAMSLLGSVAGALAGALVAVVGMWALRLSAGQAWIALIAGVCGLFFDSLLGATVERKGWLGNDLVNFASTVFAAGVAALMYRY